MTTVASRRNSDPTVRDVMRAIKDHKIQFVDLKFVDLVGTLQHITLSVEEFNEEMFREGIGFDGSSVRGFQKINESDMLIVPDPATAFVDPFFDDPTLAFFCDIVDPGRHQPYSRDSRGVCLRAERHLARVGIADTAYFGPELEFFIFDDVRFDQTTQHGFYFLNSEAAFWNVGDGEGRNLGQRPAQKMGYFSSSPVDAYQNLRSKMMTVLDSVGIQTELHHHEVAAAGQCEIGFKFGTLTKQADASIKYKYVVKNVAHRYGKCATFMPKPLFEENGSGMHVHVSLWKGGENLFYEADRYADLSPMATHFVGGILHHAPALCAFCAPTTNSYRRLVPGYEAPINLVFSQRNRSACVRVPLFSSPKAKRIEFRTPDPSCNPYLAFPAILMAGLDGIEHKIEPPEPMDEDIYELAGTERGAQIKSAPESLEEALKALERDHDFLLAGGVFTQDLIDMWLQLKRREEIDVLRLRPHPAEFSLYFNL